MNGARGVENVPKSIYKVFRFIYMAYVGFANRFVTRIPFNCVRVFLYRRMFLMKIGKGTQIHMGVRFRRPRSIVIGNNSIIHPDCFLDGLETLAIGNDVDIGDQVMLWCGGHDVQSPDYVAVKTPIVIEDRACIFARALLVKGGRIGEGAVVGAGSVVTKDVPPYTIVAGNPARKIGERTRNLTYTLDPGFVNRTW